jgi:riboflavin synthase
MFTGLVQGVATITEVQPLAADGGVRLRVDAGAVPAFSAAAGDSIALNGACMTATTVKGAHFTVDVSRESLSKTAGLAAPGEVNLETSLRLGDRIGGHLVSGHIDGVGIVQSMTQAGESWTLMIRAPRALARFLAVKGSVAVDGVSLTVNQVADHADGCDFTLNIIPHTFAVTTLRRLRGGEPVNLEIDTVARYVERMLAVGPA